MFLALAIDGCETSISYLSSENSLITHWRGGWVGQRGGQNRGVSKRAYKLAQPGIQFQSSAPQTVISFVTIGMQ
jgi:hypothetical protein